MKKLISIIVLFCLMLFSVSAFVKYSGAPSVPYIIYGHVDWQSQALGGARVQITNQNIGYSTIIITNIDGYWQEEGGNFLTTSSARPPIMFGDVIKVKSLDGCGTNDVCEKSFSAFSDGFRDYAMVDLSISGVLVVTPPPSGGGGGGGGSAYPAWVCEEWTACSNGFQTRICVQGQFTRKEKQECVVVPIVTPPVVEVPEVPPKEPEVPPTVEQPPVVVEKYTCPDGTKVDNASQCKPETETDLFLYLLGLAGAILAALGVQWYRGILAICKKQWQEGKKAQAIKTLFTLIKRAKEGAYKK